jgi:hypothetical protein
VLVGRHQEIPRYRFRSDRTFHSNGAWYFATREAIAVGPYSSRADAEAAAGELVEQLQALSRSAANDVNPHTGAGRETTARSVVIDAQTAAQLAAPDQDQSVAHTG